MDPWQGMSVWYAAVHEKMEGRRAVAATNISLDWQLTHIGYSSRVSDIPLDGLENMLSSSFIFRFHILRCYSTSDLVCKATNTSSSSLANNLNMPNVQHHIYT